MVRDLIGGIAAIVIGATYLGLALQIRASALTDAVGPAGFPKALAYAMIALGIVLCAQALLGGYRSRAATQPAGAPPERTEADAETGRAGLRGVLRAAGMLALGIVYLIVVRYLGYLPSIALLITAAALYLGTPFSWHVPAIGAAGAIVYWVVFVLILGIPQPPGLLAGLF